MGFRLIRDLVLTVLTLAYLFAPFAQMPEINWANVLFAYGPMGFIIVWGITQGQKVLNRVSDKLEILAKAILVDLLSRENVGQQSRRMAQELLDENSKR